MRLLLGSLAAVACLFSGCTLCPPGYLHDYATVGGKWERLDPTHGRVGSVLSDPGTHMSQVYTEGEVIYDAPPGGEFLQPGQVLGAPMPEPPSFQTPPPAPSSSYDMPIENGEIILGEQW